MPEDEPVRVLHIIDNLRLGGGQTALLGLLRNLDRGKVASTVVSLRGGDFLLRDIEATGASVYSLRGDSLSLACAVPTVLRLIRRLRIQIVHTHLEGAKVVGYVATRLARGTAFVCHEQNDVTTTNYPMWVQRPFARRADMVIGVSESVTQGAMRSYALKPGRYCTVYNSTDLDAIDKAPASDVRRELALSRSCRVIGFAGRLVEQKGLMYLLEAMPAVLARHPDCHLVVAGDGPLRAHLEERSASAGLSHHVTFLGRRSDIYGILKGLDVYVHPSLWEGLPMAVMEAMGACRPVVATAVDGTPEVVDDGKTGLLVPPRDAPRLAKAISAMLGAPERARAMGRAGRQRVEECFSYRASARRVEAVYEQLLRRRGIFDRLQVGPPANE